MTRKINVKAAKTAIIEVNDVSESICVWKFPECLAPANVRTALYPFEFQAHLGKRIK
jgi:hypothetical protein